MCDHKRENVVWPVDDDDTVALRRKTWVALQPRTRRVRVTARTLIHDRVGRIDGAQARGERGMPGGVVGKNDERGTQAMAEHALRVVRQHPVDFLRGVPAMRMQEL